ncbi:MAG TPA: sigma-54 dependent transcriptional regulator [Anaerohalosphaeraceae bacterium]|nr:sigma-54 dependent transcriptional regulator [Anaerohalosphaeraceae bacterium]HOL30345.1 sigma-54 dependent transcriptional regulator [Anaerohalosphaeraceae bacterium]HPC63043.1 sigma-54 dependent transcriptional regulator [Anaerohalosphaeraceae bacterium]HPO69242.1 sigma-54 dependent transcriptional regulator [Anaerohalosphaeraceae bacterium]HRS71867.1 sigma-54 dependent transcriptional regulator [Anaerohalosphaeraceae bacterium]
MKTAEAAVLIIDDNQDAVRQILEVLARRGIRGLVASDLRQASAMLDKSPADLIFANVPIDQPAESFRFIRQIHSAFPELPLVLTGQIQTGTFQPQMLLDMAVQAVPVGCRRFLLKPLERSAIEAVLDTLVPNQAVAAAHWPASGEEGYPIIGKSPRLLQTVELAKKVAATSIPVLISGESGTGKELIASLIHYSSRRAGGPYLQVNCAALSDTLLESELFGHEKGAFTGAYTQRKGRFEMAHGGTLLLDEITETPLKFQAALLRVLEQQDFERVGGSNRVRVNVRIISTTNRDLAEETAQGRFRRDLYYRLCGMRLVVPPLRQRLEDLPDLIWFFVNLYSHQTSRRISRLSEDMMNLFRTYHWPGNVRQLRNVVRTSLLLGSGPVLSLADASWMLDDRQPRSQKDYGIIEESPADLGGIALSDLERQAILATLEKTDGNQSKAAKILGISDRTLRDKIRRYQQQECLCR